MSKNRLKLIIWMITICLTCLLIYGVVQGLATVTIYFNTGADPRSALNLIPSAPPDLDDRLQWLPDIYEGRPVDSFTRQKIAGAYLNAWTQWNISYEVGEPYGLNSYFKGAALENVQRVVEETSAYGWHISQSDLQHSLELTFFADDGKVIGFTDHAVDVVQLIRSADNSMTEVINTKADYQVIMLLDRGNWYVYGWVRQSKTISDDNPLVDNSSFHEFETCGKIGTCVAGVNYYPQHTPWEAFWPQYNPEQTRWDLAIMRSLGINTVRIFIPVEQFGYDDLNPTYMRALDDFLTQADQQNLKIIVTLFDRHSDYTLSRWAIDRRHVDVLLPKLIDHSAILMWDIKNEPDRDYEANSPELVEGWLQYIIRQVRRHDPYRPITIGWSTPEAAHSLVGFVDVVSYHYYGDAETYPKHLEALQVASQGKPLLLQEFGLPTWNLSLGNNEAEQAVYYAEILTAQKQVNTAGYVVWTLYDFPALPWNEFVLPWQRAAQANFGIIRVDGILKPSANLLHPQADLMNVPEISAWRQLGIALIYVVIGWHIWRSMILIYNDL